VTINANDQINRTYAVAITLEDRPTSSITVGGQAYTPKDVLSRVPMQVD